MNEVKQLRNLMESIMPGERLPMDDDPEFTNSPENPCYDCGSTIAGHHTKLCDLAAPDDKMDLPAKPGTQYWTGEVPVTEIDDDDVYSGGDWGSSDWYGVIKDMDQYIDKNGLSPETIMQAANNLAEFYARPMGHGGDWTAAAEDIKNGWMRISKRGRALQKMFAPAEPVEEATNFELGDMFTSLLSDLKVEVEFAEAQNLNARNILKIMKKIVAKYTKTAMQRS